LKDGEGFYVVSSVRGTPGLLKTYPPHRRPVNAVSPGFTKTNLNGYEGTETVEEGAREEVRLALIGPDGPTGTFSRTEGVIPW